MNYTKIQKSYIIAALLLIPLLITLCTGLILILVFHQHHYHTDAEFLCLTKTVWRDIHIYSSIISSGILIYHLKNLNSKLFESVSLKKIKNKKRRMPAFAFWFFAICAATGFIPFLYGLFDDSPFIRLLFVELHDKFGLFLAVFAIIHIIKKWKPMIKVITKVFQKSRIQQN
jgi:hypothetical protein